VPTPPQPPTASATDAAVATGEWREARDDKGNLYYFNERTGVSQYESPVSISFYSSIAYRVMSCQVMAATSNQKLRRSFLRHLFSHLTLCESINNYNDE
jgi:hypothetical protein